MGVGCGVYTCVEVFVGESKIYNGQLDANRFTCPFGVKGDASCRSAEAGESGGTIEAFLKR